MVLPLLTSPKPKFNTNFPLQDKGKTTNKNGLKKRTKDKKLQKQKLDTFFFPDQNLDWRGIVGNDHKLEGALPYQHTSRVRGNHYPSSSSRHHRSVFTFSVSLELEMEVKTVFNVGQSWKSVGLWGEGVAKKMVRSELGRKRNSLKILQPPPHGTLLLSTVLQISGLTYPLSYAVQ